MRSWRRYRPAPTWPTSWPASTGHLNGYELVEVAKTTQRQVSHYQGELLSTVWESAHCPAGDQSSDPERMESTDQHADDEIRFALTLTRRTAEYLLGDAHAIIERLPAVGAALHTGTIDLPKARVFTLETVGLPDETARQVADQLLPLAPELTTGQLRARLRRLVITIDPDAATRRQNAAVRKRYVHHGQDQDGTASLSGCYLPPDKAAKAAARIDELAKAAKQAGDPRSMDELRADLFLDILNGENLPEVGHHRGGVEIAVSLTTLMGLSKEPGDLHGWGPVIAEVARTTVEQQLKATWKASVYDDNGELVHHGRLRRRPSTADAAFVKTRDRTCRAPGCRTPAHHADLDHTKAWEDDGHTIPANLGVLCRHCHGYKHSDGVTLEQPHPGEFIWHTRLGHTYHIKPEPP
ncbi:DUF222 domain-containing protein, partial [Actinomycetes bacterium KLBMP 9797]